MNYCNNNSNFDQDEDGVCQRVQAFNGPVELTKFLNFGLSCEGSQELIDAIRSEWPTAINEAIVRGWGGYLCGVDAQIYKNKFGKLVFNENSGGWRVAKRLF